MKPLRGFVVTLLAFIMVSGCNPAEPPDEPPAQAAAAADETAAPAEPAAAPAEAPFTPEEGFRLIALSDFEFFHPDGVKPDTWTSNGNTIICKGEPRGYAYTRESYRDFTLRFDFRFEPKKKKLAPEKLPQSNTGVLLYITGEHKQWPRSLEVQGKHVEMGQVRPNGGAAAVVMTDREDVRQQARKPVGEWNTLEIVSRGGAISVTLNGQAVCESQPGELMEGPIGFQSEGFEVHFRNLRVRTDAAELAHTTNKQGALSQ